MRRHLQKAKQNFLDSIFPKKCLSCGQEGNFVCPSCFSKTPIKANQNCFICGRRSPNAKNCPECRKKNGFVLDGILVASDWRNLFVRQIIYECKYRFVQELTNDMAKIILEFLKKSMPDSWPKTDKPATEKPILIPVPLHRRRQNWRGFNQAQLIAEKISALLNWPAEKEALLRRRHTPPQADIEDRAERKKNILASFCVNKKFSDNKFLKNKIAVLVDDVSTTGATLNECAIVLKKLNPKEIWGLVLARG